MIASQSTRCYLPLFPKSRIATRLIYVSWRDPAPGLLKLNTDGASRGNPGPVRGGGGLRDCRGTMIFGFAFHFGRTTVFIAELRALLIGMKICRRLGIFPHVIELDSKTLVDLITSRAAPPWKALTWWSQLMLLYDEFQPAIVHTYREGNCFADSLATQGADLTYYRIFRSESELPRLARGCLRLDRLGLPNVRTCAG